MAGGLPVTALPQLAGAEIGEDIGLPGPVTGVTIQRQCPLQMVRGLLLTVLPQIR